MNLKNNAYKLDNGKEYLVIEQVNYEEKTYVYLVNSSNENDTIFKEVILDENIKFLPIEPELFKNKIYGLFIEKLSSVD